MSWTLRSTRGERMNRFDLRLLYISQEGCFQLLLMMLRPTKLIYIVSNETNFMSLLQLSYIQNKELPNYLSV